MSAIPNSNPPFDQCASVSNDRDYANKNEVKRLDNNSDRSISAEFDKLNESLYKINHFLRLSKEIDDMKKDNLVKNDIQRKLSMKSQWLKSNHSSTVSLNNLPPTNSRRNSSGNISVQSFNKIEPKPESNLQRQRRNFAEYKSRSFQNVNAPNDRPKRRYGRHSHFNSFEELNFLDRIRLSDEEVSRLSQEPDFQDIKMKMGATSNCSTKPHSKLTTRSNSKDSLSKFSVSSEQRDLSKYFPKKEIIARPCNVNKNQKELKDVDLSKYFQPSPVQEMKSLPSPGQSPNLPRKPMKSTNDDHATNSTNTLLRTAIDNLQKISKQKSTEQSPSDELRKEDFTMHDQQLDGAVSIKKLTPLNVTQKAVTGYESISLVDEPESDDDDDCDRLFAGLKSPTENIDALFDKVAADVIPAMAKTVKKTTKTIKKPLSKKIAPAKVNKMKAATANATKIPSTNGAGGGGGSKPNVKTTQPIRKPAARKDISEYFAPPNVEPTVSKRQASLKPDWHKKDGFLDMNRESEILGKLSSNLLNEIKLLEKHLELNQEANEKSSGGAKKSEVKRVKVVKEVVAKKSNRQTTKDLDNAINDILSSDIGSAKNGKSVSNPSEDNKMIESIEEITKESMDIVDFAPGPSKALNLNGAPKPSNNSTLAPRETKKPLEKPITMKSNQSKIHVIEQKAHRVNNQTIERKPIKPEIASPVANGSSDKKSTNGVLLFKKEMPAISVPMKAAIITLPKSYRGIKSTDLKPKPKPIESILTPSNLNDQTADLKWTHSKPVTFEVHERPDSQITHDSMTVNGRNVRQDSQTYPPIELKQVEQKPTKAEERRPSFDVPQVPIRKVSTEERRPSFEVPQVPIRKVSTEERRPSFELPHMPLRKVSAELDNYKPAHEHKSNGVKRVDFNKTHFEQCSVVTPMKTPVKDQNAVQLVEPNTSDVRKATFSEIYSQNSPQNKRSNDRKSIENHENNLDQTILPVKPTRKQRAQEPSPSRAYIEPCHSNGSPIFEKVNVKPKMDEVRLRSEYLNLKPEPKQSPVVMVNKIEPAQSKPLDISAIPLESNKTSENDDTFDKHAHFSPSDQALSYNSSGSGDYDNVPSSSKRTVFKYSKGQSKSFDVPAITERSSDNDSDEKSPATPLRRRLSFDRKRNVSDMLIERSKMLHNRKQEFMNEKLVESKNPYIKRLIEKESRGIRSTYDRPLMSCIPSSSSATSRYDYQPYTPAVSRTLPSTSVNTRLSPAPRQMRFSPVRMSSSPSRVSPVPRPPPSTSSNRSVLDMFRHPSSSKDSCIIS